MFSFFWNKIIFFTLWLAFISVCRVAFISVPVCFWVFFSRLLIESNMKKKLIIYYLKTKREKLINFLKHTHIHSYYTTVAVGSPVWWESKHIIREHDLFSKLLINKPASQAIKISSEPKNTHTQKDSRLQLCCTKRFKVVFSFQF